jgi:Immunity protein 21
MARRATWGMRFANDGGPLIVLPREVLEYWKGADGRPVRKDLPFGPDYVRACDAPYPTALLKVGPGFGLVLGSQDHISPVQWLCLPEAPGIALVGWSYAREGSEPTVVDLLRGDHLTWCRFRRRVGLSNGELVLLHAASAGEELRELDAFGDGYAVIGDGVPVRLEPGVYAIESSEVGGDLDRDPIGCIICRWIPLGETG